MSDTWDAYAADWDTNPDVIAYSQQAFRCLSGIANIAGMEVFDFGCGTGLLTEKLSPLTKRVVALDSSPKMIEVLVAKNLPNVTPICGTLADLLRSEPAAYHAQFDLVVASSACGFVPDYDEVLLQLRSLLRPGGLLVQWDWLSDGDASGPGFTRERVAEAMTKAGFGSISVTDAFSMSAPEGDAVVLMAVARKSG